MSERVPLCFSTSMPPPPSPLIFFRHANDRSSPPLVGVCCFIRVLARRMRPPCSLVDEVKTLFAVWRWIRCSNPLVGAVEREIGGGSRPGSANRLASGAECSSWVCLSVLHLLPSSRAALHSHENMHKTRPNK